MSRITFGKELNKGKGIKDVRNKTSDWLSNKRCINRVELNDFFTIVFYQRSS